MLRKSRKRILRFAGIFYIQNNTLGDTYIAISAMTDSWATSNAKLKELYSKHLMDFYKFREFQCKSVDELFEKKEKSESSYFSSSKFLTDKKELYFSKGNVGEWKMNKDIIRSMNENDLIKNKKIAFSLMFEKESEEVLEKLQQYGYFSNKLQEEYQRQMLYDTSIISANMLALSESVRGIYLKMIPKIETVELNIKDLMNRSKSKS
jgi:hypothetical protein